jgi:phosphohistidine phosphatase SixA
MKLKYNFRSLIAIKLVILATALFVSSCCEAPKPAFAFVANTVVDSTAIEPAKAITFATNQTATWTVIGGGTINANGVYTPPNLTGNAGFIVTITATSKADANIKVERTLFITPSFALINAMQKGGYVLSFRHGIATTGVDQTGLAFSSGWWTSSNPNLARQLDNPAGVEQMRATGKALRNIKCPVGKILSSEFLRCQQSAQFMDFKNITITSNKDITFSVYDEPNRYPKTIQLIGSQPINNTNTIIVTHIGFSGSNIPSPAPLVDLQQGDAAVFKLQPNNPTPIFAGKLTTQELVALQ